MNMNMYRSRDAEWGSSCVATAYESPPTRSRTPITVKVMTSAEGGAIQIRMAISTACSSESDDSTDRECRRVRLQIDFADDESVRVSHEKIYTLLVKAKAILPGVLTKRLRNGGRTA
jgi:hypothetical protein